MRDCESCKNHTDKGCTKWKCEFEPTTKNDLGVDLISRSDVLKLMKDNWHTHNGDWAMQESMDDIRALPSVTQEPRWIPVSERLPDYGDYVLVTVSIGLAKSVDMDFYSVVEKEGFEGYGKDVIAWMPLPLPWKGE